MASESRDLRSSKRSNKRLNRTVRSQRRRDQRSKQIDDMPDMHIPVLPEGPCPTLEAAVESSDDAGRGIEAFAGLQGVPLDQKSDVEPGREGVGELQDAERGDDGGQTGEVGDLGGRLLAMAASINVCERRVLTAAATMKAMLQYIGTMIAQRILPLLDVRGGALRRSTKRLLYRTLTPMLP